MCPVRNYSGGLEGAAALPCLSSSLSFSQQLLHPVSTWRERKTFMRARLVLVPTVYLTRKIRDAEEAGNGAIRHLDYRYGMAAGETEMKAAKAMK